MDATEFSKTWEDDWNSHDLDRIMHHYCDDIVFRSQKAIALTGQGQINGKTALRAYWAAALQRQPDLKFTVQNVFLGHEMMVILYLNHCGVFATETLYFDENRQVFQAAACHQPSP
jgi:ketosteroid isomerase-like protein